MILKVLKIIVEDYVWTRFEGLTESDVQLLDAKFAVEKPGARFSLQYKMRQWDGKVHFFDVKRHRIFTHLLPRVLDLLVPRFDDCVLDDRRVGFPFPQIRATEDMFADRGWSLRDYQIEAVNAVIDNGGGILECCTGSGKTAITAALSKIYESAGYRTICIVPSGDLIRQTHETYVALGLDCGMYGSGFAQLDNWHIISTWQTLQNAPEFVAEHLYRYTDQFGDMKTIRGFGAAILDECHFGIAGNSLQTILNNHGAKIPFRIGLTGTLPPEDINRMYLHSTMGDVQYKVTAKLLMDRGYLSTVQIHPVQLKIDVDLPVSDYGIEKTFLSKHEPSIEWCAEFCLETVQKHGNTLVLTNSIPFGKKLTKKFPKDKVIFINGEVDNDTRKIWYDKLENEKDVLVIASFGTASTGISITNIQAGVLIHAPKSFTKSIQSIGRFLRKGENKTHANIYDVHTSLKYSRKHFRDRKKYYEEAHYPVEKERKVVLPA